MKLIAPSILSADFSRLGEEVLAVQQAGADWIHVDVMDGHFVPNITMGPLVVEAVKKVTSLPVDVHLMIDCPERYVIEFSEAGADYISVHVEACVHLNRTVQLIRESGAKPGVVVNPATPLEPLEWILEYVDYVLLMGVNPGFGGQSFIPNTLERIRNLRGTIRSKGLSTLIQIDGGINADTIGEVSRAGADVLVAGSAIYGSPDYAATIALFREKIEET